MNNKRIRRDDSELRLDNKRAKLDFGHQTNSLNGIDGMTRDGVHPASDNANLADRPKLNSHREKSNILNKQISMAKRSGKVKTTQELIQNLGIESCHSSSSPPAAPHSVNNLVPDENKEELMYRFFRSQGPENPSQAVDNEEEDEIQVVSRPGTAVGDPPSSTSHSAVSSRVVTPAPPPVAKQTAETIDDVLALLEPIDPAAVKAEWEEKMLEEEDIEGLIPVYKPRLEITEEVIQDLNDGQLEHIGGVRDHTGEFKEWHEMVSKETTDGNLLHILPYSVID